MPATASGMLDVRLAGCASLALVGRVGELVDARQPVPVEAGIVGTDAVDEPGDGHGFRLLYRFGGPGALA